MTEAVTTDPLIQEIAGIVERACAAESNIFGYGIWTHHIARVAENARRLAAEFGADADIVEIAALLHDYASVKDESLYEQHQLHGPVEAERILRRLGVSEDRIAAVRHCIAVHRASAEVERRSAEAECLAAADAMAHVENVPSLLYLAYVRKGLGVDEGAAWVRAKLVRSWQKIDPRVRESLRERYEAALKLLPEEPG